MDRIKLVIFDVDGLMLDTESVWKKVWKDVGEEYGVKDFGTTIFLDLVGVGGEKVEEVICEKLNYLSNPLELLDLARKKGKELLDIKIDVKPGVFELLDFLDKNNIKKAIATSTSREISFIRLNKLNLWNRFDFILCGDEILNRKPHPDIYLKILEQMNFNNDECLVLEDSKIGVEAAYRAKIPCIMVPDIVAPTKNQEEQTYAIVNNLYDVKKILKGLL